MDSYRAGATVLSATGIGLYNLYYYWKINDLGITDVNNMGATMGSSSY